MDRSNSEGGSSGSISSATNQTEKRALNDVSQNTRRGGNYGSLAKSQLQPTFYICHQVESNDTMQRLALKYSINIQDIKRVNKLWSDAELNLLDSVYIPVNATQLATLRNLYPTLNFIQASPTTNPSRSSLHNSIPSDQNHTLLRSSDSSTSIPTTNSTTSAFQDYFSKIDEQINSTKKTLEGLDIHKQYPKFQANHNSNSSLNFNSQSSDESVSSSAGRNTTLHHGRSNGNYSLSENSVFVTIPNQTSRDKHVYAALERIQREKDDFDEL